MTCPLARRVELPYRLYMPILFSNLLTDVGIDPKQVKVLRHTIDRADLFAVWRRDRPAFERYQSIQLKSAAGNFRRPLWASCIALDAQRTVFVGMYRAKLVGSIPEDFDERLGRHPPDEQTHNYYDCELSPELGEYAGKLFIGWNGRNWRQNGEGGHAITALTEAIRDPDFPGLLEFIKPLSEIPYLPDAWRAHLRLGKGVYLLTCPTTREQYVGKADGDDGFWGRWMAYVVDGHGGNIRLKSRDRSDYQVSVLEVAGTSATPREIGAMEERWKRKLQSRDMGLNAN